MSARDFLEKVLNYLFYIQNTQHPLLGPHVCLMKWLGVWHPVMNAKTRLKLVFVYITIAFFFSQYIRCCRYRTLDALKPLIQFAPFHTAIIKIVFFLKDHEIWSELIAYISSVEREELSALDPKIHGVMKGYIKHSRRLSYFFWIMGFLSNLSIFSDLYQKVYDQKNVTEEYIRLFDGYTPFNREPPGYYYILTTQFVFANIVTLFVMAWDPLIVAIMIFFAGQLRISGFHCAQAIELDSYQKSHQNIVKCHLFHSTLTKYQNTFNSLISPVMFLYLIVTSVNLGVSITEMVELQDDLAAFVYTCVYVMACLVQLLFFYWHSNEVTEESLLVSYSTFESDWPLANINLQKEMTILAHTTNKRLAFQAGPFNEMSLITFVSILRGSYSFYTLLNESN